MMTHRIGSNAIAMCILNALVAAFGILAGAASVSAQEPLQQPAQQQIPQQQSPLHQRIDSEVTAGSESLAAPLCSDGEFLRRIYLDFAGTIPSAAEARAFLDDSSPDKRAAYIDRLIAGPRFARQMTVAFDNMLMERRPQKHIEIAKWRAYLYDGFAADKPLDQLFQEILSADGADPTTRPAARFVIDRDVEPNLLARDVGRIVFGHDVQCAQCHNHPLIDDYYQRDYYELFAFFNRTKLFTTKDKQVVLMDDAQGEVSYQSVFDKSAKGTVHPRVPHGQQIEEPNVGNEPYTVPPANEVRHIPKFSRRVQLAGEAIKSRQFARNLANRLWAMLMGRGIVDPVDLHHSDNPPVHPQLLEILTDELIARKYSAQSVLREIALSKSYQRSSEMPEDLVSLASSAAAQIPKLSQEREQLVQVAATSAEAAEKTSTELAAALVPMPPLMEDVDKQNAALAAARKAKDEAVKGAAAAQAKLGEAQTAAQMVSEAAAKAKEAAEKLPAHKELTAAGDAIKACHDKLTAELAALNDQVAKLQAATATATEQVATASSAVDAAASKLEAARTQIAAIEPHFDEVASRAGYDAALVKATEARIAALKPLADLAATATDPSKAAQARSELTGRWSQEWLIGSVRPLTPEQFAWSTLKAVGVVDNEMSAAAVEIDRQAPLSEAVIPDASARAQKIEQAVFAKLSANVDQFIRLFGAGAGQPQQEFFATVDQTLFIANGAEVKSWLAPNANNLTARLAKIDDAKALAEELYLSVYTRRPVDLEVAAVADYLKARGVENPEKKAEKTAAVQELTWGLLASVEFRFIH